MQSKKTKIIGLVISLFLLAACTFFPTENVVIYERFPKELSLYADSMPTQKIYDNLFLTLSSGKLVVSSFKADTMMHFYSTPALNYLYSAGEKGHGKNEMQSFPTFCRSMNSELYVRGFTVNSIRKFSVLDNKLLEKSKYELFLTDVPNDMYIMNDTMLYYNDLTNNEIKCYNIRKREINDVFSLSSLYGDKRNHEFLLGTLCMNDSLGAYAFQYKHEIVLMKSKNLSYVKTVRWKYDNQGDEKVNHTSHPCLYYTDGYATSNRFYLLCRGANSREKNACFDIEVYNHDFTPISRYKLDRRIFKFVVDEAHGYLYGFGKSDDYIYRYKLFD